MDDTRLAEVGERIGTALGAGAVMMQRMGGQAWAGGREAAARAVERPAAPWLPDLDALRREVAELIAPPRRRRWPWVVLGAGAVAVAGIVWAWQRPIGTSPAAEPPRVDDLDEERGGGTGEEEDSRP